MPWPIQYSGYACFNSFHFFLSRPSKKRQAKNKKFGFGGQKKRSKHNTKQSVNDMSDFSVRKHNTKPGKGGKKSQVGSVNSKDTTKSRDYNSGNWPDS